MVIPKIEKLNGNHLGRLHIQKAYPEFYEYLITTYKHVPYKKFSELIYLYHHNMIDRPKCKCCDNKVDYLNFTDGYRTYCSVKCQTNDPDIIKQSETIKKLRYGGHHEKITEKSKKTKLERYGNECYNNMDKNRETCLQRYGVEHYTNRDKAIQTTIDRYGVPYAMQNKDISKKSLQTKIKKYGIDNVSNQAKTKQTCLERYGVENVFCVPEFIEKSKKTKLKKYGDEYYWDPVKIKQTNLARYGVENPSSSPIIREKVKQTVIDKYGVDNVAKLKSTQEKMIQTCLEKYGESYYTQTDEYKKRVKEKQFEIQEKINNSKKQNNTFNTSSIEDKFKEWLNEHNIEYKSQYRSDSYPFNCDFYFPKTDLYLEIQGFWSHGKHPYDPNNKDDIDVVKSWESRNTKFYDNAIDVWTRRDPLKRQWAKEHNLNWKEVFTIDLDELLEQTKGLF